MSNINLSRFIRLGINAGSLATVNPFNQLDDSYRKQVIFASGVIEFAKGDTVFKGHLDRSHYYFLLKGKIFYKTGLLSKKSIGASDPVAQFDISSLLPDGVNILAAEPGHLLSVEADMLDAALAWMQAGDITQKPDLKPSHAISSHPEISHVDDENDDDWMTVLLASPLFFNLPPANISRLFVLFERIPVRSGDVIVKQGDDGDDFYVLISGQAEVVLDDCYDKPAAQLSQGSYFGEGALVSGEPRSASVIMTSDGEVGRLDRENFQSLLKDPVVKFISPEELGQQLMKNRSHCVLVDVRSPEEFAHTPSANCHNIPCRELRAAIPDMDKDALYFISQEGGKRSELAAHLLSQANLKAFVIRNN
jgi:rhodanese-related sulfurtransferase